MTSRTDNREKAAKLLSASREMAGGAKTVADGLPPLRWGGELSNSARTTFLNCRKKWEWQYGRRLSPRKPSVPFLVGGLVHDGLERMYTTGEFDEAGARGIVDAACDKASRETSLSSEESDRVWEQQAMVMGILKGYAAMYLEKDLRVWDIVSAESQFSYSLPGKITKWAVGKRDMVVKVRKTGKVGLVEHKTAGRLDANYIAKLPLDAQIMGYANSILKETGRLPDFVVYNVMKKSQLRRKQAESFEQFQRRIEEEYTANPTVYFYRETLSFTPASIAAYEREQVRFANELDRAIEERYFSMNTSQCTAMGVCPYMRLCIEGANKDTLAHYRVRSRTHEELSEEVVE